ncbi:MAG: hypothetical protein QM778_03390 [Myxococcales bacterium]
MRKLALWVSLAALAAVSSARADGPVSRYRLREGGAFASTYVSDDCGWAGMTVWVSERVTRDQPGAPERENYGTIWYDSFSYCTGVGGHVNAEVPFKGKIDMKEAALSFSVPVEKLQYLSDGYGGWTAGDALPLGTLSGSITFAGEGPIENTKQRALYLGDGVTEIIVQSGKQRSATASFDVGLDGHRLAFAPQPTTLSWFRKADVISAQDPTFNPVALRDHYGVPGGPNASTHIMEQGGAQLDIVDRTASCQNVTLFMTAGQVDNTYVPTGPDSHENSTWLQFSMRDECEPGIYEELYFWATVNDSVAFTNPLESLSVLLDVPVTATRCLYTQDGGGCEEVSVQLTAEVLFEGNQVVQGGTSVGTYRYGGNVIRANLEAWRKTADVSIDVSLDGEPLPLVAPEYATVQAYRSEEVSLAR